MTDPKDKPKKYAPGTSPAEISAGIQRAMAEDEEAMSRAPKKFAPGEGLIEVEPGDYAHDDADQDLPEFGELNGKPIRLRSPEFDALDERDRREVVVELPGKGKVRPWRFIGDARDFTFPRDDE
jgi:hypothetical protein